MTPPAPKLKPANLVTHIYDHLTRCQEDCLTGELVFRVGFRLGGIRQVIVEKNEQTVINGIKKLD